MPLQATSGAASYDGFGGGVPVAATYIEDVFSTWLYTGQGAGSSQTIVNGIDLSTKGGLVWLKNRSVAYNNNLFDTARGVNKRLFSNSTSAELNTADSLTAFNSNGFTIGTVDNGFSGSGENIASWTFRKQPKFFDVVTYTGNGTTQNIAHSLGSTPGCIIVKSYSSGATYDWAVYHRSLGATKGVYLNTTQAEQTNNSLWNDTTPTSTQFTVGNSGGASSSTNANGVTYVAYLFAHNAGGFGLTGTDNVISCGSYTGNGSSTGPSISLGYEPQWLMIKRAVGGTSAWNMYDTMRGMPVPTAPTFVLQANSTGVEYTGPNNFVAPNATGFDITSTSSDVNTNGDTYIYIAIRRGPMKTPTTGTSVFSPTTASSEPQSTPLLTGGSFPSDMVLHRPRYTLTSYGFYNTSRLTGNRSVLATFNTNAQADFGANYWKFDNSTAAYIPANGYFNNNGEGNIGYALYSLRRAPGFFDVVCFTAGTSTNRRVDHNLTTPPQLILLKARNVSQSWYAYSETLGINGILYPNQNWAPGTVTNAWGSSAPTATNFGINEPTFASAGDTYVAYLFATVSGVSKVGSYTGTGTTKQIDCGFTGGARFVLIKRTDSTGDWYVWDSARGIVSGNDPYLLLNSTAAEVTNTDYVDTYSAGFEISSTAPAAINANGGSFIFLAIA